MQSGTTPEVINLHQRCKYSDSAFKRIYFFYTAGSGNGLEVDTVCPGKLTLSRRHLFLIEKYIEDARQDEKHVPDLLEAIIQLPGLANVELRQKLFKIIQIESEIKKMRVSTFWIPEIRSFRAAGQHNLLSQ